MKSFDGKVAAITGAASGIGRAIALNLAGQRCHLALSDVDEEGLAETVALCEGFAVKVTSKRVDVADRNAVFAWADEVVADHGRVNLIFNNAGVSLSATVEGMAHEDFAWLMDINFWGVVHGTQAFLPHLQATRDGHVVNVSSVFGLTGIPSQSAYNAAKFAVRGFTEALRIELDVARGGVSTTVVHPGGIKTNIARNGRVHESAVALASTRADLDAKFDKIAFTSADKAARGIVDAVLADRRRVLIGPDARIIDVMARLPFSPLQRIIGFGARRRHD